MRIKIVGTGSYVPERVVTNEDLAGMVDTSDEWIKSRTGICQRRISDGIGTSGMAAMAARRALANGGVRAEEIQLILLATSTPDCHFPSSACQVQREIGAVHAAAYDISAACSGFIFALNTAYSFIVSGFYNNVLVIGVDCLSKVVDWKDRSTCVLFGDGAGAVVVTVESEADKAVSGNKAGNSADVPGILHMIMGADGTKGHVLSCESRTVGNFLTGTEPLTGYLSMDGQEVFKFAVKKMPEIIEQLLEESNVKLEEIKYFVLHQANYRISESIAKRLKIPMERVPVNIEKYGNTSAGSVPILLDELNREGKLKDGDLLVMAGFGAGLTWGAALIRW
ncbi:MAG: ketoacyl-ACP synthase III [Hungatella sp.]|nr:ketoacyl-ACP synthase III [Hungatella sp.]